MKKPLVVHPLLFAIFPILSLFSYNLKNSIKAGIIAPIVLAGGLYKINRGK